MISVPRPYCKMVESCFSPMSTLEDNLLYKCLRIRLVEEKIIELYPSDLIQSPVHLSIGQEAVAVGFCEHLTDEDLLFINYRGHAFYLAKGGANA